MRNVFATWIYSRRLSCSEHISIYSSGFYYYSPRPSSFTIECKDTQTQTIPNMDKLPVCFFSQTTLWKYWFSFNTNIEKFFIFPAVSNNILKFTKNIPACQHQDYKLHNQKIFKIACGKSLWKQKMMELLQSQALAI